MRTTLDIQIGDNTLEVEVSYSQGSRRAYFGNGDYEDYNPTTVEIEDIQIISGCVFDLIDYCASHPSVLEEIKQKCEDILDQRAAA